MYFSELKISMSRKESLESVGKKYETVDASCELAVKDVLLQDFEQTLMSTKSRVEAAVHAIIQDEKDAIVKKAKGQV